MRGAIHSYLGLKAKVRPMSFITSSWFHGGAAWWTMAITALARCASKGALPALSQQALSRQFHGRCRASPRLFRWPVFDVCSHRPATPEGILERDENKDLWGGHPAGRPSS